ncbi:glycosyltransferase [Flavobacterium myungsuense]|uniref:Glycosyltransferase n=1 Tax=Flavobacterium myungsuense TaxID=651823 RepID=A0ABW3IZE1_9FLAO
MKILVIQQKMIGDVLLSTILCDNLRIAYPNATIDYMVYESTIAVLQGNKSIDNLILFEDKHKKSNWEFLKLLLAIRKNKYDMVIDAYAKIESYLTVLFSGANQKISFSKNWQKILFTDVVDKIKIPKSNLGLIIEQRLSLLNPLNLKIDLKTFPKLYLTSEEVNFAKSLFKINNLDSTKKTVMVSIIGSSLEKTYPSKFISEIIDRIANNYDVNMLFNYIPNQIELARTIYNNCQKETQTKIFFDVIGKNLREFIAIMNECDLIIGNDGGAINMAKALDKPSFTIFSPWIDKKGWATFEDGITHVSVHLNDYKPDFFTYKTKKEIKKKHLSLYNEFNPNLFQKKLDVFLNHNLLNISRAKKTEIQYKKYSLSGLVITYNEEHNIEKVIEDLDFADEIIIVDSFSTDNTVKIAQSYKNVKVYQYPFENYAAQRNYAISLSLNPWILFLDADERLTPALKEEIIQTVLEKKSHSAYYFFRISMFKNTKLNFSGRQTEKILRLFKKENAYYDLQKTVHEKLIISGTIGTLKHKLIHFSYSNYSSYKQKMIRYGFLKAGDELLKGTNPTVFNLYIRPIYQFIYLYIIRLGVLDGKNGLIISYLNALSIYVRFRELKKMKLKN